MNPGDKVQVIFKREHWPIRSAVYVYEGCDDKGIWVRRKDGVQRYILNVDIQLTRPAPADGSISEEDPY